MCFLSTPHLATLHYLRLLVPIEYRLIIKTMIKIRCISCNLLWWEFRLFYKIQLVQYSIKRFESPTEFLNSLDNFQFIFSRIVLRNRNESRVTTQKRRQIASHWKHVNNIEWVDDFLRAYIASWKSVDSELIDFIVVTLSHVNWWVDDLRHTDSTRSTHLGESTLWIN